MIVDKIDKNLFDYTYKLPKGGLYKSLLLLMDKINQLVDEQNTQTQEGLPK